MPAWADRLCTTLLGLTLLAAHMESASAQTSDLVSQSSLRVCADPANTPMSNKDGTGYENKLAEFINNYPDRNKLKIMFLRESEGVYQFGSKRVAVRVEKDKINVRVGGGYLAIDEFLD